MVVQTDERHRAYMDLCRVTGYKPQRMLQLLGGALMGYDPAQACAVACNGLRSAQLGDRSRVHRTNTTRKMCAA